MNKRDRWVTEKGSTVSRDRETGRFVVHKRTPSIKTNNTQAPKSNKSVNCDRGKK